jgi:hypothetical protein
MLRGMGRMIGAGLLATGLGWIALLLAPGVIEKKTLPQIQDLSSDTRLAPGSVLGVLGFLLFRSCRPRPKPLDGESATGEA